MANFMGHDINIHRVFYGLPQKTIAVEKMGKLLLAFDKGIISQLSVKTLDEIEVKCELSDSDDGMSDADEVQEPKESSGHLPNEIPDSEHGNEDVDDVQERSTECCQSSKADKKQKKRPWVIKKNVRFCVILTH